MPNFRSIRDMLDFAIRKEDEAHDFHLDLAQEEAQHQLRLAIEYDWAAF